MCNNGRPICWVISFLIIYFSLWLFIDICQSIIGTSLFSNTPFYNTFQSVSLLHSVSCSTFHTVESIKNAAPVSQQAKKKIKVYNRVGPHNIDILSIIFGSLLGKGDVERKKDGTRITFYQEAIHMKYSLFLYNQLKTAGYCKQTRFSSQKQVKN